MNQFIVYTLIGLIMGICLVTNPKFQELCRPDREKDPIFFDLCMILSLTFFWPIPVLKSMFYVLSKN
jgi:hypothetical protein